MQASFFCISRFILTLHTPLVSTITKVRLLQLTYLPVSINSFLKVLGNAYTQDFVGDSTTKFIKHLEQADGKEDRNELNLYAKAISVVQSSGTGKSRMLTEVCSCLGR